MAARANVALVVGFFRAAALLQAVELAQKDVLIIAQVIANGAVLPIGQGVSILRRPSSGI